MAVLSTLRSFFRRPLWPHNPAGEAADHEGDPDDYIEQVRAVIDSHGFDLQIFLVAASGFLTDSYNLFASNVILPCLTFVYWNTCGHTKEIWINITTLFGSAVGMLVFGYLADRYGRRSLYGIELYIVIFSTLLIAQASAGYGDFESGEHSMSIYAMLLAWRFMMGVGIGAEPLSACITAEWASTKERGRMMCAVFLMQPLGQLLAWGVGLASLEILSHSHDFTSDSTDAKIGIDKLWRWVIGLGAVPAVLAILFRLTIPESGRYTYDVQKDGPRALQDTLDVFHSASGWASHQRLPEDGTEMQEISQQVQRLSVESQAVIEHTGQDDGSRSPQLQAIESTDPAHTQTQHWQHISLGPVADDHEPEDHVHRGGSVSHGSNTSPRRTAHQSSDELSLHDAAFVPYSDTPPSPFQTMATDPTAVRPPMQPYDAADDISEDESEDLNHLQERRMSMPKDHFQRSELMEYFWHEGNWRYLAGTSVTWFLLDIAFYGLGFNSPSTMAKLWTDGPMPTCGEVPAYLTVSSVGKGGNIYQVLYSNARQSLLTTSIASCVGSLALILAINHIDRRVMLIWSFIALAVLLLVTGIVFLQVFHTTGYAATIVLYALNQLVFSFGPNTLTFIIPAEIFPTRYRCTCHGIAAASGKMGAVLVQFIFLAYENRELQQPNSRALGKVIIIFAAFMILGALFAWAWIPAVQTKSDDPSEMLRNIDLETLALGEERLPVELKVGFRNKLSTLLPKTNLRKRTKCQTKVAGPLTV
ncbi:hypothetical protein LTR56_007475 [Elasticomyces elasticus]|nr:hypothetical protein LTR56_007475 [Elasticomyces elasticus]KAK3668203.1 hypothetical protein LTR22_000888 [Elasticomyces elasticus]